MKTFKGQDDLREWLESHGFTCSSDSAGYPENKCNWHAYRRSELSARVCECNDTKTYMQIVVKPSEFDFPNGTKHRGVEIELCGEAGGVWWNLKAYGLKPDEMAEKLGPVEASLIAAWNALRRDASSRNIRIVNPIYAPLPVPKSRGDIAAQLRWLSGHMADIAVSMDYSGGLAEWSGWGGELADAALSVREWAREIDPDGMG